MSPRRLLPILALALLGPVRLHAGDAEDPSVQVFGRAQAAVHAPQTPHFNSRNVQLTTLVRHTVPEAGRPITTTALPPGCGMGVFGGLDRERTLELAIELFRIYGYELRPDLAAAGVRLDGLDPEAKVGFLIHPTTRRDARMPVEEGTTEDLTALERGGYRVLILPGDRYLCMQGDTSSPLHAALLSITEFLADLGGKHPPDLSVLARGQPIRIDAAGLEGGIEGATTFQLSESGAFIVLDEEASVALEVLPPPKVDGQKRPTLVTLPFYWTPPWKTAGYDFGPDVPLPSFTLLQDGMPPLSSGRAVFLAGPAFDPAKPFRILLTLRPGQTHLGQQVWVRTSTGKRP